MSMSDLKPYRPKPPSKALIAFSSLATLYLLWVVLLAEPAPSGGMLVMYWVALGLNLLFLISTLRLRK